MRTPTELGKIVKARRLELGRTQVQVVDVARAAFGANVISEPTYRAIEAGRTNASDLTLTAVSRGLNWPPNALIDIRNGADVPTTSAGGHEIQLDVDAAGADLEQLRREDPAYFEQIMGLVRSHLRRRP